MGPDPIDLKELAEACVAAGFPSIQVNEWGINGMLPSYRLFAWKLGDEWTPGLVDDGLSAYFAFALRDAVRAAFPCTYTQPTKASYRRHGGSEYLLYLRDEKDGVPSIELPWYFGGKSETECWARALVALYRAGLLATAHGEERRPDGDHEKNDAADAGEQKQRSDQPHGDLPVGRPPHVGQVTGGQA